VFLVSRYEYFEQRRDRRKRASVEQCSDIILAFKEYLDKTANSSMTFYGMQGGTSPVTARGEYVHRWTLRYRNRLLARFYKLDEWFALNPCDTTMLTLTTRHSGFLPDQFVILAEAFRKLRNNIRQDHFLGKFSYFYVFEPHEDGYAHIHMLLFMRVSEEHQERIKNLWCNKYGVGVADAQDFKIRTIDEGLTNPKNYMMKYLVKTFEPSDMENNSPFLLFNACAWYMGRKDTDYKPLRFWNCSQDLQPVLKLDDKDNGDVYWYKVEMSTPDGDALLWQKDHMAQYPILKIE